MRKLSTLFLLSVILFGCGDYGDYGPEIIEEGGDILPLEVGNYWTFQDSIFDEEGQLTSVASATVEISGMSVLDLQGVSKTMYYWHWYKSGESELRSYWWLSGTEDEGHCYYGGMTTTDTVLIAKSVRYKYPVAVGDVWDYYSIIGSGITEDEYTFELSDTISVSCIGKDVEIITPAGSYSCYVYQGEYDYNGVVNLKKSYLSPGYGYIAYDNYSDGVLRFRRRLIETNL